MTQISTPVVWPVFRRKCPACDRIGLTVHSLRSSSLVWVGYHGRACEAGQNPRSILLALQLSVAASPPLPAIPYPNNSLGFLSRLIVPFSNKVYLSLSVLFFCQKRNLSRKNPKLEKEGWPVSSFSSLEWCLLNALFFFRVHYTDLKPLKLFLMLQQFSVMIGSVLLGERSRACSITDMHLQPTPYHAHFNGFPFNIPYSF